MFCPVDTAVNPNPYAYRYLIRPISCTAREKWSGSPSSTLTGTSRGWALAVSTPSSTPYSGVCSFLNYFYCDLLT